MKTVATPAAAYEVNGKIIKTGTFPQALKTDYGRWVVAALVQSKFFDGQHQELFKFWSKKDAQNFINLFA